MWIESIKNLVIYHAKLLKQLEISRNQCLNGKRERGKEGREVMGGEFWSSRQDTRKNSSSHSLNLPGILRLMDIQDTRKVSF